MAGNVGASRPALSVQEVQKGVWILVVDDEASVRTVVSKTLKRKGYGCVMASSVAEAQVCLNRTAFDVVVTDVQMPGESGLDLLAAVKDRDSDIQVIMMTGNPDLGVTVDALRSRADDFLAKPFQMGELFHAIERAVEHRRLLQETRNYQLHLEEHINEQATKIQRFFGDALFALVGAIEARDQYTGDHVERVTRYALSTGSELNLSAQQLWNLWAGSLFHDVGKIAIPDSILGKKSSLTDKEFAVMKKHPELGTVIIRRVSFLQSAVPAIIQHHERWDGQGYPAGLEGEDICIEGRILCVCDSFDAMTTDRPYREGCSDEEAVAELIRCAGTQYDPEVVEAFCRAVKNGFPVVSLPIAEFLGLLSSDTPKAEHSLDSTLVS